MARLADKIVLITGAAGAVGRAVAAAVEREGGVAVATDVAAGPGIAHVLDVTSQDDWLAALAAVERGHARLEGLVNAAGIALLASVEDTDYSAWRRVLDPSAPWQFPPETRAIHLWNEQWRRAGQDKDAHYDVTCLYERLKQCYLE